MPRPEPSQVAGGVKKPVAKQGGEQQQQQQQQQLAPDSAALFDLLNSGYGHEYQAQAAAVASQQFQHPNFGFNLNFPSPGFLPVSPPGLPHMMPGFHPGGYPPPHLLPPVQQFKCFVCPATFEKREAFLYHLNFHSSYLEPSEAAKQGKYQNLINQDKTNSQCLQVCLQISLRSSRTFTRQELQRQLAVRPEDDSEDLPQLRLLLTTELPLRQARTAPGVLGVAVLTVSPTDIPRRRNKQKTSTPTHSRRSRRWSGRRNTGKWIQYLDLIMFTSHVYSQVLVH